MADPRTHLDELRQAYQLWNDTRGASVSAWLELFDENIALRSLGGSRAELEFGTSRHGKADADEYFKELGAAWELIHFKPEEFIADADRVVVLSHWALRSRRTGKVAKSPKADVFRFRDGKIVEFFEYFDTAAALAAMKPD